MTVSEYINKQTINALLDNNQKKLNGLLEAAQIACGAKCPEGHDGDQISFMNGGEMYCEVCDETYMSVEATVDRLQDLGFDVYAE